MHLVRFNPSVRRVGVRFQHLLVFGWVSGVLGVLLDSDPKRPIRVHLYVWWRLVCWSPQQQL